MNMCDACDSSIKAAELKVCKVCRGNYHYQCLGISSENFMKESKQFKINWKCPQCKTKEKRGDNSNTPIRSQQPESPASDSLKVSDELKMYFDLKFQEISTKISKEVQLKIVAESKETNTKIQSLTDGVQYMTNQFDELRKLYEDQSQEISALKEGNTVLKEENNELKKQVRGMNSRLSQVEQQSRDSNLEIQCVPEVNSENVMTIVKQLSQVVAYNLGDNELMTAHRVAKLNNDSPRPRAIIVKLTTPHIRDNFLASIRIYNRAHDQDKLNTTDLGIAGHKRPIFISEHLSPANKQLHAATRAAAAEKKYQFVWIRNGRIFARKDIKSKPILIKDLDFVKSL